MTPEGFESLYKRLGRRIRHFRKCADMTQEDLGLKVDLGRTSIASIETGNQGVYLHVILRIAEALKIDPFELIGSCESERMRIREIALSKLSSEEKDALDLNDD